MTQSIDHSVKAIPKTAGVILAAGESVRFGGIVEKQFLELEGKPIFLYSVEKLVALKCMDPLLLVVPEAKRALYERCIENVNLASIHSVKIIGGGCTRQESCYYALTQIPSDVELVLIHDAARPLAPLWLFELCLSRAYLCKNVTAAIPLNETLKSVDLQNRITSTLNRNGIWITHTPQILTFKHLLMGHELARITQDHVNDDAELIEQLGIPVSVVPSTTLNIKVTEADDLPLAACLLRKVS